MLRSFNQKASKVLNSILIAVFVLLVLDVLWGVGTRYVLGNQARWSEELARLLMVWLAMLGAALATREGQHLGLDVVVRQWSSEVQRLAVLFVHLAVAIFAFVIMAWGGGLLVADRFESGQMLPALNISRAWFYLALPVSGTLITIFSFENFVSELKEAKGGGV